MPYAKTSLRSEKRALRERMRGMGCDYREIAAEFARVFRLRPRAAWRDAYGWSLQETADRINSYRGETGLDSGGLAGMTAPHLSEYENWPGRGAKPSGRKPGPHLLAVLAGVYRCDVSDLVDAADREHLPKGDLLILDTYVRPSLPDAGTHMPVEFWAREDVSRAVTEWDIPALLVIIAYERRWTQSRLAEIVGYSQSWVSNVMRRDQPLTVKQAREIALCFGAPLDRLTLDVAPATEEIPNTDTPANVDDRDIFPDTTGHLSAADRMTGIRDFGKELTRLMAVRGIGVRELARVAYCNAGHISNLRNGKARPSQELAAVLDRALGAGGELLGIGVRPGAAASAELALDVPAAPVIPVHPQALDLAPDADLYERITRVVERRARVDSVVIAWLERCLAEHRRVEDSIGAAPLVSIIRAQLSTVAGMAREAPPSLSDPVVNLAAQYAQFMAWLCNDLQDKAAALVWYDRAHDWAIEAGDANMAATTLSMKAHLAWSTGDAVRCVRLGEAARWNDDRTSLGVQGMASQMTARGYALDADAGKAHRALDEAESLIKSAAEHPEDEPAWMYFYGETWFTAQRGMIETELAERGAGDARYAVALIRKALGDLPESYRRDRAWYGTILARAHIAANEYDAAAGIALKFSRDAIAVNSYAASDLKGISAKLTRLGVREAEDLADELLEAKL